MAKDTFYFPHDYNARNDPKLQDVLFRLGHEGKSIYWDLVEMLYENGGFLQMNSLEGLSFTLRTTSDLLSKLINDFRLFESDGDRFWSVSVKRRLKIRRDISKKRSQSGSLGGRSRSERMAAAKHLGTHSKAEWQEMKDFFGVCVKCSGDTGLLHLDKDHIIPVYQGGSDSITNIQPLCAKCNAGKGSDTTDYRVLFCLANAKQMPSKWVAGKERKGKEIKVKKGEREPPALFVVPTFEEVEKYFLENKSTSKEARKFCNHYNSNGWLVAGKTKMKNWHSAALNCIDRQDDFPTNGKKEKSVRETLKYDRSKENPIRDAMPKDIKDELKKILF